MAAPPFHSLPNERRKPHYPEPTGDVASINQSDRICPIFTRPPGFLGLNPENPVNPVQKSSGRNLRGRSPGLIAIYESKDYLFTDGGESDTERSVVRSRRKDVRNHRNSCSGYRQHACRAKGN